MKEFRKNIKGYKIKTDNGYLDFSGIAYMGEKPVWKISTVSEKWIECTDDHKIYFSPHDAKPITQFFSGDVILTEDGLDTVFKVENTGRIEKVYDVIDVAGINRFYGNNILVSNCRFITFSETLINPMKLAEMKGVNPITKTGQIRWYKKIDKRMTYLVSLDPCLGTGGDNAAIQVFELPTFKQVAEWQHNKTPIEGQIKIVRDILKEIYEVVGKGKSYDDPDVNIYWTVESNTVGEAALLVIRDTGEENFPGTFLNDRIGKRKGYCTTNKMKIQACSRLKEMVEKNRIQLCSKNLISELKSYIAKGITFEAKQGETDDLVSALLLIIRMAQYIAKWDDNTHSAITSSIISDGELEPLPILVL